MPTIALIATIFNEEDTIQQVLESIAKQTHPPDEIVLVDGGSSDSTIAIIESFAATLPIKLLVEHGCNISQGRNIAIQAAQAEVIAVTDAGVRIPPHWLASLTQPFRDDESVQTVAGFFHADPDPQNPFEVAMSATVLPLAQDIDPPKFLPSSRSVAFKKSAWQAVGGYPEWLDYSEDLVFDLRLKQLYGDFPFVPEAHVFFKPRTSLRAFCKQYYLYARGDGKADLWRKRHLIRYITYLFALPVLLALSYFTTPVVLLALFLGGVIYLRQPLQRLPHFWGKLGFWQKLIALSYLPIIRATGDIAKMIGYPVGIAWRRPNNPPDWRTIADYEVVEHAQ